MTVQPVATADVRVVFEYVGQLSGAREVEVRARVTGILARRHFTEGSAVRRGQLLFTLDAAPCQAALAKADAAVASAEARMLTTRAVDDAVAEGVARAEVASARAAWTPATS